MPRAPSQVEHLETAAEDTERRSAEARNIPWQHSTGTFRGEIMGNMLLYTHVYQDHGLFIYIYMYK